MSFNIEIESGKTVKLATAGKYCDSDIVVTAKGKSETEYTNVLKLETTTYVDQKYWSPSTADWAAKDGCRSVIFVIPSGTIQLRLRGPAGFYVASPIGGSQISVSNSPDSGFVVVDRWYNLAAVDDNNDTLVTIDNSGGYTYCCIPLTAGNYSNQQYADTILTINEPIG